MVAGYRNRHWEKAHVDLRLTKELLQNMRSFGYTKVRYLTPVGSTVEDPIEELLRA